MKTVLLLSLLSLTFVGCNSESSSSSARKCVYNEKDISCEEFDRITGRTAQTGKPHVEDNSPILGEHEIQVDANGTFEIIGNKLVIKSDLKASGFKTIKGKKEECRFEVLAGTEFDVRVDERVLELSNKELGTKMYERRYPNQTEQDDLIVGLFDLEEKGSSEIFGLMFFKNRTMSMHKICIF